jgi:hypothetical protein
VVPIRKALVGVGTVEHIEKQRVAAGTLEVPELGSEADRWRLEVLVILVGEVEPLGHVLVLVLSPGERGIRVPGANVDGSALAARRERDPK